MLLSVTAVRRLVFAAALALPLAASAGELCVATGSQPLIQAAVTAPARVYFHSDVAKADHYVDMHAAGTGAWAVLPRVGEGTTAVDYRVATRSSNVEKTVATGHIKVANNCAAPKLSNDQRVVATGLIVGSTKEGPAVPAGFRCDGIVGQISAKGELRANKPCQQAALQRASAATSNGTTVTAKPATATKAAGKTSVVADALLTPGTERTHHPPRRPNPFPGNNPPPPNPRTDHPMSRSRP